MTILEMQANGGKFLVEAAKDVEDECVIRDEFTQVNESVSHGLEALAVLGDGQVALDEVPKLGVKADSYRDYDTIVISRHQLVSRSGSPRYMSW